MKVPLEELLRQRALVQEHLNWLDKQISLAKGEQETSHPTAAATPSQPANATSPEETTLPLLPDKPEEALPPYAKIGCIALGILFCLFFLFLIFVLPYLIYN